MTLNDDYLRNRSFLAEVQQRVISMILPRIPAKVSPRQMTMVGMSGALVGSIGLIGCNVSFLWLPVVTLGIAANWFGDSLDGALAHYRREDRSKFDFLIDRSCDLFSLMFLIAAFGLSPFLSLVAAMVILLCYLLFSSYTYIRAAARHDAQMSYLGVGATEFRILMIAWANIGALVGLREPFVDGISRLDIAVITLAATAIIGLAARAVLDARQVAKEENASLAALRPTRAPRSREANEAGR